MPVLLYIVHKGTVFIFSLNRGFQTFLNLFKSNSIFRLSQDGHALLFRPTEVFENIKIFNFRSQYPISVYCFVANH